MTRIIHKITALFLAIAMVLPARGFTQVLPYMPAVGRLLPAKGVSYDLPYIVGMRFSSDNIFKFTFILNKGNLEAKESVIRPEVDKIGKYFLAALTVAEKDIWVNLSPYEQDRIINPSLGMTDLGKDMLGEDYVLKQLASSLTFPDSESGKKYWQSINGVGANNHSPANNFNKVWIVPGKIKIMEANDRAVITEASLKVMTEQDYLAMEKNSGRFDTSRSLSAKRIETNGTLSDRATNAFRQNIIPIIEKEVNTGKDFAHLRQLYRSIIMAEWFKKKLKSTILNQVYFNKEKIKGADCNDPKIKDKIYNEYVSAFKTGVYNIIKKESVGANNHSPVQKIVKRQYFSGGVADFATVAQAAARDATAATPDQVDAAAGEDSGELVEAEAFLALLDVMGQGINRLQSALHHLQDTLTSSADEFARIDHASGATTGDKPPSFTLADRIAFDQALLHNDYSTALTLAMRVPTAQRDKYLESIVSQFLSNGIGPIDVIREAAQNMSPDDRFGFRDAYISLLANFNPANVPVARAARSAWEEVVIGAIDDKNLIAAGVDPAAFKKSLARAQEIFGKALPDSIAVAIVDGHYRGRTGGAGLNLDAQIREKDKPIQDRRFAQTDYSGTPEQRAMKLRPIMELAAAVRDRKIALPGATVTDANKEAIYNAVIAIGYWAGMVGLMGVDKLDGEDAYQGWRTTYQDPIFVLTAGLERQRINQLEGDKYLLETVHLSSLRSNAKMYDMEIARRAFEAIKTPRLKARAAQILSEHAIANEMPTDEKLLSLMEQCVSRALAERFAAKGKDDAEKLQRRIMVMRTQRAMANIALRTSQAILIFNISDLDYIWQAHLMDNEDGTKGTVSDFDPVTGHFRSTTYSRRVIIKKSDKLQERFSREATIELLDCGAAGNEKGEKGLMGVDDESRRKEAQQMIDMVSNKTAKAGGSDNGPQGQTGGLDFAGVDNFQITTANGGIKLSGKKAVDYLINGKVAGAKLITTAIRF